MTSHAGIETLRDSARELLAASIRRARLDVEHAPAPATPAELAAALSPDAEAEPPDLRAYPAGADR